MVPQDVPGEDAAPVIKEVGQAVGRGARGPGRRLSVAHSVSQSCANLAPVRRIGLVQPCPMPGPESGGKEVEGGAGLVAVIERPRIRRFS